MLGSLPTALAPFAAYRQFITFMLAPDPRKPGKMTKLPTSWQSGHVVSALDAAHWTDFETAAANAARSDRGHGVGVGFVFTEHDPFWFLDIDDALLPDGTWSQTAQYFCQWFAGAAVEVSQSGRGLHIFGTGTVPEHGCKNVPEGLEFYTSGRFVALSGTHATGDASKDCTAALAQLIPHFFPPAPEGEDFDGWTDGPVEGWDGPADDDDLLRRAALSSARNAAVAFGGGGVSFTDLWEANAEALGARWPSSTGGDYDGSSADMALACHLAFWTGKDCERMERLMRRSALVRDKWDRAGDDYLARTILRACATVTEVAKGRAEPLPEPIQPETAQALGVSLRDALAEFMPPPLQIEHFAGCVYITDINRVWTPRGEFLDKARFDVAYGGHIFVLDPEGQKTTDSAWEAFTMSRVFRCPIADAACFRPEMPPGSLIEEEGRVMLNTYIPIETVATPGDPARFLTLLEKLLPDERDRQILLSYMAACLQYPGRKFQWWPVLQGAEGNGKTALLSIMAYCIGQRYTHLPNPDAMAKTGNQFNGWIEGNLFIGIEEICVGERRNFLETFKSTVANERLGVERKGQDQTTGDNRANGMLLTNHRDGVPITVDMRRYCVFFTAQQNAEHLVRDGLTPEFFADFYDWLNGRNAYAAYGVKYGFAVVNHFLRTYQIAEEFNPATVCTRAPRTSTTAEAVRASLGRAEQEVLEAVEEGREGFAGGWVSSIYLSRLLKAERLNVPLNKRRAMMNAIGYDYHPHLPEGRVPGVVMPDGGKPRLYVKEGSLLAQLTDPAAIVKRYSDAQAAALAGPVAVAFGS